MYGTQLQRQRLGVRLLAMERGAGVGEGMAEGEGEGKVGGGGGEGGEIGVIKGEAGGWRSNMNGWGLCVGVIGCDSTGRGGGR